MSDRGQRCAALLARLSAEPLLQWDDLFVAFHDEGFLLEEIAVAIECSVASVVIGFASNLEPRGLRAGVAAEMLENIGLAVRENEDIKGGADA